MLCRWQILLGDDSPLTAVGLKSILGEGIKRALVAPLRQYLTYVGIGGSPRLPLRASGGVLQVESHVDVAQWTKTGD
jgi:hypothetical protein